MTDQGTPSVPTNPPGWLDPGTLGLMETEARKVLGHGRDALAAAEAALAIVQARYPALPAAMLRDAITAVIPDPEGLAATRHQPPAWKGEALAVATPDEIAQSLAYALRFDERGKPRRTGLEAMAHLAGAQLARHLALSNYVVMRRPPAPPHRVS